MSSDGIGVVYVHPLSGAFCFVHSGLGVFIVDMFAICIVNPKKPGSVYKRITPFFKGVRYYFAVLFCVGENLILVL